MAPRVEDRIFTTLMKKVMMIEKEFVPYDIALAMKELGFDDKSLAMYTDDSGSIRLLFDGSISGSNINVWKSKKMTSAPLYQQAFRWFREKYKLYATVYPTSTNQFGTTLCKGVNEKFYGDELPLFKTFAEAQDACLRKLIEIVKEKID